MTTELQTKPPAKSRIIGNLYRDFKIERAQRMDAAPDGDEPDQSPNMVLTLSFSSEEPYTRASWFDDPWIEVLGHNPNEVDLTRLNDAAPVLVNHWRGAATEDSPMSGIGVVERAWLEGGKGYAQIKLSRRDGLEGLLQDIEDGIIRNVSVGYIINERQLLKDNGDKAPDEYRVTSWMPFEISLVDIPADQTVGIGRSHADPKNSAPQYRVVEIPPAEGTTTQGVKQMPQEQNAPAVDNGAANVQTRTLDVQVTGGDALAVERERAREITALGRQFDATALADTAIEKGVTVDAFRAQIIQRLQDNGKLRPAESPEIGLSEREAKQFSFCRALLAAQDPHHAHKIAPFEMECSRAAQDKRGDSRDKTREAAITIPVDVLMRGLQLDPAAAASAAQMMIQRAMQRDLVVGTPTAGGNMVATDLLGASFIDLLRNAMVIDRLGVTWLRDLNGNVAIPSQTGAGTHYWVAENGAPNESQQTIGQVTMTPKTVGAFTDFSRRLLLQSSLDVEAFVRMDLAKIIGLAVQDGALNGTGASNQPTGLFNTSGIGSVAGGANGAAPTYAHMVDLESAVANANAAEGNLAYLTNTKVRGKLRKTEEFATTNGRPVWTTRAGMPGVGEVLGYEAYTSNAVPSNLTKGTASGVCSAVAFGNWSDLMIGLWGGLDIMLDPYTGAAAGTKRVIALQDLDIAVRHAASFSAMLDALTT